MLFSPFDQFELSLIFPIVVRLSDVFVLDLSLTTSTMFFLLVMLFLGLIIYLSFFEATFIPNRWQSLVELIYKFVVGLLKEQAGAKGEVYFPLVFTVFCFILISNLLGLLPFGFTVTSQIIVTFTLALSFFIGLTILGFKEQGLNFLKIFVPSGVPGWLLPLLIVIEIMSYCIRPLSLSIRLFANMLAGHILLYIIAGAAIVMFGKFFFLGFFPWAFVIVFMILEIGIAFLQAYVFTILLCIYMHDSLYGH